MKDLKTRLFDLYNLHEVKGDEFNLKNNIYIILYDRYGNVYQDGWLYEIKCTDNIKFNNFTRDILTELYENFDFEFGNLEPICFVNNSIVFSLNILNDISKNNYNKIKKTDLSQIEQEVFNIFYEQYLNVLKNSFQNKEIITNKKYKFRYLIHNYIVKKFLFTKKRKHTNELENIIINFMDNPKKVLDVSCGDNKFIFNLLKNKNCEEIIGNDISWSQIEILLNTFNNQNHIYTNHNLLNLKFKENYFDVSYCSNTLHHLQDKNSVQKALKNMFFISRKIIVLEIEKPSNYKGLPYLLNKYYYQGFLKDVGENYLTRDEFTSIINETIEGNVEIKFTNFTNIMGNYLIAEITKKD